MYLHTLCMYLCVYTVYVYVIVSCFSVKQEPHFRTSYTFISLFFYTAADYSNLFQFLK